MSNMPVETLEYRYPVRVEEYALRPDSCGAGRWRGGLGLIREYRFLGREATLQLRADREQHLPYGLAGGASAAPSVNVLNPGRADEEPVPAKVTRTVRHDDVVRHEQPGGGGYGDPAERCPDDIRRDIQNGKITPAYAKRWHGFVET